MVKRLEQTAQRDWEHSHKLDLSDEGLAHDIEKRGAGGSEKLVLDAGGGKKKH